MRFAASSHTPMVRMVLAIVRDYPQRAVLGLVLMALLIAIRLMVMAFAPRSWAIQPESKLAE